MIDAVLNDVTEKEKIYNRQISAPILKRKSSRFGLGQFLSSTTHNNSNAVNVAHPSPAHHHFNLPHLQINCAPLGAHLQPPNTSSTGTTPTTPNMLSAQQFQHLNQQYQQQGYSGGSGGVGGGLGAGFCVGGSGASGIGSAVMYGFNLGAPGRCIVHGCVISNNIL